MTYIDLINRFWELDETWQFSCCETRLYFYLLKTANRLGWEDSWTHSDERTAANVGVSKNSFKTARNRLCQAGLIEYKEGGNGYANKTRYRITCQNLTPKLSPNIDPNIDPNLDPLYNKNKNKNKNKTKTKEIVKEKTTRFSFNPPTLEEVKAYCREMGNSVDPERFYYFYQSKGWMVGKNKMKDWKAAVRTWEKTQKNGTHKQSTKEQRDEEFARHIAQKMGYGYN